MKNIVHVTMEDFGTGNVSHHESSVEWKITPDLKDFHNHETGYYSYEAPIIWLKPFEKRFWIVETIP